MQSTIHVQPYSCYGDGMQKMHHTNSGAPSTSAPARKFPQISPRVSWCSDAQRLATASCGWDFWLVWTVMRSFLLLLVCLPDHDLRIFIIGFGFFPVGKKAALAERQEMRLLSCNECFTSLLCTDFLQYHMQSAWPQLPSIPCRDGGKKEMHWDYGNLSCCRNKDLLKSSVNDQHQEYEHLWPKRTYPSPTVQFQQPTTVNHSSRDGIMSLLPSLLRLLMLS